jgi:hypothetical protein
MRPKALLPLPKSGTKDTHFHVEIRRYLFDFPRTATHQYHNKISRNPKIQPSPHFIFILTVSSSSSTMKLTLAAFTALLAPAAAEIYFKEQFNDDVSF